MSSIVASQVFELGALADAIAGVLTTAKCKLFQNNYTPTPSSVVADFTAATYVGNATATLTFDAPSVSDDGHVETHATPAAWRPTNGVTPNTIYGLYITDTTGADLLFACRFDGAPLPMNDSLDVIITVITLRLAGSGISVEVT